MKLPLWVYDYKQKRYVVFPFHLLETFPNGKLGFTYDPTSKVHTELLQQFGHFFTRSPVLDRTTFSIFYDELQFELKARPERPKPKGLRWYSQEQHQIKGYKRKGARR